MRTARKPLDFYKHVSAHIKSLQILGLWLYIPYPKTSVRFWLHVLYCIVYGILVATLPPLAQIAYIIKLLASDNFQIQDVASSTNLVLTELLVSFRLLDLFCRRGLLTQLIDQLVNGEFHRTTHRTLLENAIKLSRRLFWFFLLGCSLDVFFHMVVAPGLGGFQTLPVKMELIFVDANEPPYFGYVCFYQIMYKPMVVLAFVSLQILPCAFLLFPIAQLDILIDNFKHVETLVKIIRAERNCNKDEAFKEVFKGLVLHHRAIISFVKTAEAAFGGQFALTLMLVSTVICFTGVQFFSIESPSNDLVGVFWVMAYLQLFLMILFTDSYFGNSIYVKSTDLATVAYGSPWLDMPQELKKNLVLVIARAQKPLVITACKLVPISLPTFTAVMNWTYKAFAVMNGMKK